MLIIQLSTGYTTGISCSSFFVRVGRSGGQEGLLHAFSGHELDIQYLFD